MTGQPPHHDMVLLVRGQVCLHGAPKPSLGQEPGAFRTKAELVHACAQQQEDLVESRKQEFGPFCFFQARERERERKDLVRTLQREMGKRNRKKKE